MNLKKKINIIVGGRFHSAQTYKALLRLNYDVKIYASSPKRYFKDINKNDVIFIPKLSQLIQKLFRVKLPRIFNDISSIMFDFWVSIIMRDADFIWGYNGDSLYCGKKIKNFNKGLYIVDRACPHFIFQERLMLEESKKIGFPYLKHTQISRYRFCEEYELADKIVVPSKYSFSSFLEFNFSKDKLFIAPLDSNAYMPDIKSLNKKSKNKKEICIGFVGGAFLRKGTIYLLRAIDQLSDKNIRLILRTDRNKVFKHKEAREICERNNVVFIPYLKNMVNFYSELDIFVLPSIDEGFGMVLFEALKYQIPVIASSNVGAIDNLIDGQDYLKVMPKDSQNLKSLIIRLKEDIILRKNIGRNGRRAYEKIVSEEKSYLNSISILFDQL